MTLRQERSTRLSSLLQLRRRRKSHLVWFQYPLVVEMKSLTAPDNRVSRYVSAARTVLTIICRISTFIITMKQMFLAILCCFSLFYVCDHSPLFGIFLQWVVLFELIIIKPNLNTKQKRASDVILVLR